MSFAKLLAAGKSIISGRRPPSYREDKHVYLPNFGAPKNPFAASAPAPNQDQTRPQSQVPPQIQAPPVGPAMAAAISSIERAHKLAVTREAIMVAAKTQKMPVLAEKSKPLAAWASKLNPVAMFRPPPAPAPALPAVQAELSLDTIKVVHNDLSDADVEVVPIKSRPAVRPVVPDLPPAEKPWELLGERMLRVERMETMGKVEKIEVG